ncbi:phosphoribosyltransferase family protein [Rhodohalobacter sp. SW132]|uniref:phosphoribosyltransferase family protein n=2 Tax=Rhodohalobacter sp. SW132 TaxID=2293433 RepID=UPI001ADFC97E|nr:phosphoribosyltransferase family protein [Rhodohalobacter sp. SW132]
MDKLITKFYDNLFFILMILLDQNRLQRILKRMAYQLVETSAGRNIDLVGLNERGYSVASVLEEHMTKEINIDVSLHQLFVDGTAETSGFTRKNKVLIAADDVIYSGKTMFKALNHIEELYDYEDVYVAAVIDRGHRKLPVEAGIVGVEVPTKINEHVDFQLKNNKPHQVLITKINPE